MAERQIVITSEAFGHGFDIRVQPPADWANFDAERPTYHEAVRYARALNAIHRWRIVDRTPSAE